MHKAKDIKPIKIEAISAYNHVKIEKHPLRSGVYGVFCTTFKHIPPYFGTLKECKKAAEAAEANSIKLLANK